MHDLIVFELLLEIDAMDYHFGSEWTPLANHIEKKPEDLFAEVKETEVREVISIWQEAFGLAVVEPMARGKPVVATTVGGIPEIIEHGVTGLLVPPGDESALANAIGSLLEDQPAAAAMGRRAQRIVAERFTPESQLSRFAALVTEVLPRSAGPT